MADALDKVAHMFQRETGFEPQQFEAAVKINAGHQGRANALLADLDWYLRHTEATHQRLRKEINKAI